MSTCEDCGGRGYTLSEGPNPCENPKCNAAGFARYLKGLQAEYASKLDRVAGVDKTWQKYYDKRMAEQDARVLQCEDQLRAVRAHVNFALWRLRGNDGEVSDSLYAALKAVPDHLKASELCSQHQIPDDVTCSTCYPKRKVPEKPNG